MRDRQLCSGVPDNDIHRARTRRAANASIAEILETDEPVGLTLQRVAFVGSKHFIFDTYVHGRRHRQRRTTRCADDQRGREAGEAA